MHLLPKNSVFYLAQSPIVGKTMRLRFKADNTERTALFKARQ